MKRDRRITVRYTDQEYASLTELLEKERSAPGVCGGRADPAGPAAPAAPADPAALRGGRPEDSISTFIRERSLTSGPEKELKRIRLILTRMETTLQQISLSLKRDPAVNGRRFLASSVTDLEEELRMLTAAVEKVRFDGGNGPEAYKRGEEPDGIRSP